MLVVDLDGEPLAPLRALEEILLCLGTWEDDDREDRTADTGPLRLSASCAGPRATPSWRTGFDEAYSAVIAADCSSARRAARAGR